MRRFAFILTMAVTLVAAATSCERISKFIHGEAVARVGTKVLYRSQVEEIIPKNLSAEDSTKLAQQYINSWARENLFVDVAMTQLSKSEQDVSNELEAYRRSLLSYRYEQRYVNERLDTLVSETEIRDYYNAHSDMFKLEVPIVKARFLDIMSKSSHLETLKRKMSSSDYGDLVDLDSLAYVASLRYEDKSETWVDLVTVARNCDMEYGTLAVQLVPGKFIQEESEKGDIKLLFVCDMQKAGTVAPEDYCSERIKDIIISARKRTLVSTLERELLEDALEHEHLIIY